MPPSDAGSTRIQLCGRLKADVGGRHVTPALRGRQGRVLLAYLVLNRGRPVSRDELIDAIWPDSPPVDPSAALRTQLSRLRSALGPGALAGRDAVELRLPENTWIDIEAAERAILAAGSAIKATDWKDAWAHAHIALNISGRPFLAGFDAPWVEEVRRELEELLLRTREIIARAGIGLGGSELAGAERAARTLIRAAPFRESGYLHLMRALVASGNTAEALRSYDELRNLLAEELGSAPGAEIQALHKRLLGGVPDADDAGDAGEELRAAEEAGATAVDKSGAAVADRAAERRSELPLPTWLVPRRRSPFIGRVAELERLDGLWSETRTDEIRHIAFIGGDPGVGKTRLATEFAKRVHSRGGGVLYGRADEEGTFAYQPFVEALRHWVINAPASELKRDLGPNAAALAALIPEVSIRVPDTPPLGPEVARERLFEAVTGSLSAISAGCPTLLVIDDVHWADPGSLQMLRHIARSPHRTGLMILATYRETEPSDALAEALADLGREGLFERQHLSGLSAAEVTELIASIRGSAPEPGLAEAIRDETGGNPFLIEALVNHIAASGDGPGGGRASRRATIYASGVPDLVREAIGHRVGELGPGATRVLEVASVIGRKFDSELLTEVSDMPGEEVIASLEAAVSAGLLADIPGTFDRYAFSHALFRQTVYAGVPRTRRAGLHRRLAEVLERHHGSDPRHVSELARHFAGAGPAAAPKALEYGVRAGASALGALAFDEAIEHYNEALAALDATGSEDEKLRCELLLALGEAEWRGGDPESSRETFSSAARIARSIADSEALARAALGFCGFGSDGVGSRNADATELLEAALGAAPGSAALRSRLAVRLAEFKRDAGQPERAEQLSLEALEQAEASADPDTIALALIGRWNATPGPADLEQRAAVSGRLEELAPRLRDHDVEIQVRFLRVLAALESGDFAELDVAIAEHAKIAEQMKHPAGRLHRRAFMTMRSLMEGQFADAERLAAEVLELGAGAEARDAVAYSSFELVTLRWEQGRIGEMEEAVRDLIGRPGQTPVWRSFLALLLAEAGRSHEAAEELDAAVAEGGRSDPGRQAAVAVAAIATAALGDGERAASLYEKLLPDAAGIVVGGAAAVYLGPVSHHLGVLAAVGNRTDKAVDHLTDAVAVNERAGALPWLARSRFELALVLAERGGNGDSERAGTLLADAGRTAEELGMESLLRRMGRVENRSGLASQNA
jgi:DNA-binding SARP family transcriptional activator/tetratricopeptide (TPR) repeat protein